MQDCGRGKGAIAAAGAELQSTLNGQNRWRIINHLNPRPEVLGRITGQNQKTQLKKKRIHPINR